MHPSYSQLSIRIVCNFWRIIDCGHSSQLHQMHQSGAVCQCQDQQTHNHMIDGRVDMNREVLVITVGLTAFRLKVSVIIYYIYKDQEQFPNHI